jgi:hypothetical protein
VCPNCGGSLQKRFLTAGCLTSAPPIVIAMAAVGFGARAAIVRRAASQPSACARAAGALERATPHAASDERVSIGARDDRRGGT